MKLIFKFAILAFVGLMLAGAFWILMSIPQPFNWLMLAGGGAIVVSGLMRRSAYRPDRSKLDRAFRTRELA